jgi:hypothetical protein
MSNAPRTDLHGLRLSELTPAEKIVAGIQWLRDNEHYGIQQAAENLICEFLSYDAALRDEAVRVLTPFAHDDLCCALGGNVEGDDSIIFQRVEAALTLGDCRRARAFLAKHKEPGNDPSQ